MRVHHSQVTKKETQRKFALGTALLTQGLKITKTETREVTSKLEDPEHFLLVYGRGGTAAVYEAEVIFLSLGDQIQPSRLANLNLVTERLRKAAPQARYDDRLLRLGRRPLPFEGDSVDVVAEILRNAMDGFRRPRCRCRPRDRRKNTARADRR